MNRAGTQAVGIALALLVVVSVLPAGMVGPTSALPPDDGTFTVRQGETCFAVEPYRAGDLPVHVEYIDRTYIGETEFGDYTNPGWTGPATVKSVMDYRYRYHPDDGDPIGQTAEDAPYLKNAYRHEPWEFSTYGLYDWSTNGESHMFFYDGPEGVSLVVRHDRLYDTLAIDSHDPYNPSGDDPENPYGGGYTRPSPGGGSATFEFENLPRGEWAYLDDLNPAVYSDSFASDGTTYAHRDATRYDGANIDTFRGGDFTADWAWKAGETDGGAYRGLENMDGPITITPAFNQSATRWRTPYHSGSAEDEVTAWTVRGRDGATHELDMDRPVTIERGATCSGGEQPPETTETETETETPPETVTETETQTPTETPTPTETERPTTREPTTQAPTTTEERRGSGGGGGGSSGGGYGSGGAAYGSGPPSVITDVSKTGSNALEIDVQHAGDDDPVRADLAELGALGDVAFTDLELVLSDDDPHFVVHVRASSTPPAPVPALADAEETLGYLHVDHRYLDERDVRDATVTVEIPKQRLADDGLAASDVALYGYDGDVWSELDTSVVEERGDAYVLEARSPEFTDVAVGATRSVSAADLSLAESTVVAGDPVTAIAAVENTGDTERTYAAALALDGTVVETVDVTIPAGATREVQFTHAVDSPGTYTLSVDDATAELTVESRPTETAAGIETSVTDDETNGPGQPGFGVVAALVALVSAFLLARRRS